MARLGDVCEIVSGTTPKSNRPEYWDGEINWITPAEIDDDTKVIFESQRKITEQAVKDSHLKPFPAGTVILSSRAPIGKVAIAGTEMYCNQGFKNLICSECIDNTYLFWFLKSKTEYLNSLGRGATFKEISKSIVEEIEIPLPPLDEQRRIAAILDKVTSLIALRKQQLAKLDELVKARFVEMFGDLTLNPYGWEFQPLSTLCDVRDGTHDSPTYVIDGYPLLTSKNFSSGALDFSGANLISKNDFDKINQRSKVDKGDIVMPMIGTIGHPVIIDIDTPFAIKNVALIKFGKAKVSNIFVKYLLDSDYFRFTIQETNRGGTQKFISLSDVRKLPIPIVLDSLQQDFAIFVEKARTYGLTMSKSLDILEVIRKLLLKYYFTRCDNDV